MPSWTTAIVVVAVLAVLLLEPADAHRKHKIFACRRHERMLAFRKIGGLPRVAILKYKMIDDNCEKVQTDPPSTDNFYISHDCRRCERGSSGKWTCSLMKDKAEGAEDKPNCRSVLGPDCKPHLANKRNRRKPCL